jgi:hypothetical protein
MESHVKTLGILHIALGIMGVFGALVIILIFGGAAGIVSVNQAGDADAKVAVPILAAIGGIFAIFVLLVSLPGIIAGFGLLKHRAWARILTIILSAVNLLNLPIGTALGIYGLWVLLQPATERLFAEAEFS